MPHQSQPTGLITDVEIGSTVDAGTYIDIDGRPIWHLRAGEPIGPSTVLVHGAFASAATWAAQIADFSAAGLDLYVPERSGHGHSPDVPGPFTFPDAVAQTITYLETQVEGPANLIGWADGALTAHLVAAARPDLVNRLVLACHYINVDGARADDFFAKVDSRDPDTIDYLRGAWTDFSPDPPEHFDDVLDKSMALIRTGPQFEMADFAEVDAPTLIVAADRGVVRIEHSLQLTRTLPDARLAVLPGTHIVPVESPELFNPLVISFLAADPPRIWVP